ncbi:hypothetical protein PA598K_00115 [Paenibacillus sp. 598K]|uniref:ADP-ribosylglycohydrolase family protein n=1 Tax=Paenibacillus sp. 598K TaxID=1117987 RepID=UPI000FF9A073|nr:ADP-ribosylglycohydrolase family protein [Paenibacillus sp. 598K]GBF71902.1 hypothetical protein PA598K_00115 [Paenibacillus sp. 598K]
MKVNIINEADYYRIVYGGWLGKNIGGTLGAPVEGAKELLSLTYYPELPDGPLENDDLDLQLVWLHALEQYGPGLTARELGQEWLDHIFFPFDEYGVALTNLRRGLLPPLSGVFNNPFNDCMGSPIRSEIWAMVSPGLPEQAARYAYEDAIVDHAGGEGVYGEMFFAAIESAIFVEQDRDRLIAIGMRCIPTESRTYRALADLLRWHQEGKDWIEARALILEHHGHHNFTDAPQNIAFTILGWLYGSDFEDCILKAVNCGYDTDCTAATLAAILGMLLGPEGLPDKWVRPVGDRVVVSPPINGFDAPRDLDELTRRTIWIGKQVLAHCDAGVVISADQPSRWEERELDIAGLESLWSRSATSARYLLPQGTQRQPLLELLVEYGEQGPAIGAGQEQTLRLTLVNRSRTTLTGELALELPENWQGPDARTVTLQPDERLSWAQSIRASETMRGDSDLVLRWTRRHDGAIWSVETVTLRLLAASAWTVWGPGEGDGDGVRAFVAGNRIDWERIAGTEADGVYRARTTLDVPSERCVRLIAAANSPVRLTLEGETLFDCRTVPEFMPAYHRAPEGQRAERVLRAGRYNLEVEVERSGQPLATYVLPVAPAETTMPGPHYYYTDIVFGAAR